MAGQGKSKLVAIVDDDDSVRSALHGMLKAVGLPALAFASAEEFLNSGKKHHAAGLIADIRMPGISGLELQAKLNAEHCRIPTIFITAHGDAQMRMQALRAGAVEFLAKRLTMEPCSRLVERLWNSLDIRSGRSNLCTASLLRELGKMKEKRHPAKHRGLA